MQDKKNRRAHGASFKKPRRSESGDQRIKHTAGRGRVGQKRHANIVWRQGLGHDAGPDNADQNNAGADLLGQQTNGHVRDVALKRVFNGLGSGRDIPARAFERFARRKRQKR